MISGTGKDKKSEVTVRSIFFLAHGLALMAYVMAFTYVRRKHEFESGLARQHVNVSAALLPCLFGSHSKLILHFCCHNTVTSSYSSSSSFFSLSGLETSRSVMWGSCSSGDSTSMSIRCTSRCDSSKILK